MSDNTRYIIGVDIGTSSAKSIVLRMNGEPGPSVQLACVTRHPEPGYSEQSAPEILDAVKRGIREVVAGMDGPPAAISFSSAMHSIMAVDGEGAPLTPLIIWADNRSEPYARALRDTPRGLLIYRQTGTPVHAMSPLSKLMWMREQQPGIFAAAAKFPGIKEYILYHFTGRYLTDHSIASATGLFDIHALRWNADALEAAGVDAARLPVPVPADYVIRELKPGIARELGIPATTPIVIGGSDGCLAQLGSNALDEGHATLTIGTSGAVRMAGSRPLTDSQQRLFTYLLTDDTYITGGATNNGGVVLQWLVRDFLQRPLSDIDGLVKEALNIAPERLICLPYLLGERAPIWDSNATAAFIGIQPRHVAAHFTRAVLEGICFALLSIRNALGETAGPVKKISVSGGFTNAPGWIQLLADIFGQTMYLRQTADASAMGAIYLAADTLGLEIRASRGGELQAAFEPDPEKYAGYQEKYQLFLQLQQQLLAISH
jgi:gluconokinase